MARAPGRDARHGGSTGADTGAFLVVTVFSSAAYRDRKAEKVLDRR